MKRDTDVHWNCPECQTLNIDDYRDTAFPACLNCEASYFWDEIISLNEMDRLNALISEP